MSKIIPFVFDQFPIRVVTDEKGEALFVGKDICDALGYKDATTAIRSHCKGAQILHPLQTGGGVQDVRVLSVPDMMRLVVHSALPAAQAFERLVYDTILPTIRQKGAYIGPGATLESLPPALALEVGEIIKAMVHQQMQSFLQTDLGPMLKAELESIFEIELPRLMQAALARQQLSVHHGQTASQVWAANGLARTKGSSQFLSRCLIVWGCASQTGGEQGGRKARRFDADKSAAAMKHGLLEYCKKHIAERKGSVFTLNRET